MRPGKEKSTFTGPLSCRVFEEQGLQVTVSQQILASGQEMLGYNSVMD